MTAGPGSSGAVLRRRLDALRDAATLLVRHGIDTGQTDVAGLLVRAEGRLRHGTEETVVALAGGTGSGKSSLLNAIAGSDVARSGVTRPTTAITQAVTFGRHADGLLDHLGVTRRHHLEHQGPLTGLVLLDLPDFDSVASAHRDEVDRLVRLVDLLVWVTDPQKYADQALHEGYLAPLAAHADVVEVLLNKVDLLTDSAAAACLADLRDLLVADGLAQVEPLGVSATTGAGLDAVVGLLAAEVQAREAAVARLSADIMQAADALALLLGPIGSVDVDGVAKDLAAGLSDAAGVPQVADLVAAQHRRDAALATGWPPLRWIRRLRRAPLARLQPAAGSTVAGSAVSRSLRAAGQALTRGFDEAITRAVTVHVRSAAEPVTAALDTQISRGAQDLRQPPRWWRTAGAAQSLLLLLAAVGGVWLLGLALADSLLRLDVDALAPQVRGLPVPTAMLLGGLLGGVATAALAALLSRFGARRRARNAVASLQAGVARATEDVVIDPVRTLLADVATCHTLLEQARTAD